MTATTASVIILAVQIGIAAVLFFARHKLQRWATKSVEHHFDIKLEQLRADLRKKEDEYKAEIARQDKRVDAFRSPGMQILVAKRNAISQRQLQAIDQLWDAVGKQTQLKFACRLLQPINLEAVCEQRLLDANTKMFFEKVFEISGLANVKPSDHHAARPYVTDQCWAIFSAYQTIGGYATAWLVMLKSGLADRKLLREDDVISLTKAALPSHAEFIEQHGAKSVFFLMDTLESAVLQELQKALDGNSALDGVEQAKAIVSLANALEAEMIAETNHLTFPKT